MDKETAAYIKNYFSRLMTKDEQLALMHHLYTYKTGRSHNLTNLIRSKGWISATPNVKEMLKDGYEEFELNVARRIIKESPEKVFLNNCPKCGRLARTPFARQCRLCGHSWHNLTVAQFKVYSILQLTSRPFFLVGQIATGNINVGHFVDLTVLGLNTRPKIESIEYVRLHRDGKACEDIALGTNDLTEEDKDYLNSRVSFGISCHIIREV
jgi:hypothetical protein